MKWYNYIVISLILVGVFSCKVKKTCPAYHSYFILKPENQDAYFTPFGKDSIPEVSKYGKNKFGLMNGCTVKSFKKRHYTVPMQDFQGEVVEDEFPFETNATDIDQIDPEQNRQ